MNGYTTEAEELAHRFRFHPAEEWCTMGECHSI